MLTLVNKTSNYYQFRARKFGPVIGQFSLVDQDNCNSLRIVSFCILKGHRGKGYGQQMLREALEEAKRICGNRSITLNVQDSNSVALHIYQKHGFKIMGSHAPGVYAMMYKAQDQDCLKVKSIECLEVRPFYDSKWLIKFTNGSWCTVTRYDTDNASDFIQDVEKCKCIEEVQSTVDLKNSILYD